MAHRTTVLFDDSTQRAAKQLASHFQCSTSEAIRRAVVEQRDLTMGVPLETRQKRVEALHRLFELFEGHDADAEIQRLKAEDEWS